MSHSITVTKSDTIYVRIRLYDEWPRPTHTKGGEEKLHIMFNGCQIHVKGIDRISEHYSSTYISTAPALKLRWLLILDKNYRLSLL